MQTSSSSTLPNFLILCLIWGSTWIGIKVGVEAVPPLFYAGSRFTVAGVLLLVVALLHRETIQLRNRDLPRLIVCSLLMISLCYGPLFWGMQYVNSGTAAVLELSLTPVALMTFALVFRQESWRRQIGWAILLGILGLGVLYGPDALAGPEQQAGSSRLTLLGMLAISLAAFVYGLGSAVAKPLLERYPAFFVAGTTTTIGGAFLLFSSIIFEEGALTALRGHWGWTAWSGWAFLVLFGSLIGYTIFMRLLRDIGASRAGSYAFVSPVIAVALGVALNGEEVGFLDCLGMLLMIAAAYLALKEPPPESPRSEQSATVSSIGPRGRHRASGCDLSDLRK
jgi:drug/metabolite transporter (DMT)-like permease